MEKSFVKPAYKLSLLFILVCVAFGCAKHAPLKPSDTMAELDSKGVALFSLKTSNSINQNFQPNVKKVVIRPIGTNDTKDREYEIRAPYKTEQKKYYEYLIVLNLEPGEYQLVKAYGYSRHWSTEASFSIPLSTKFTVSPGIASYHGSIDAFVRLAKGNEPTAGSLETYRQSIESGYFVGTFDVRVYDRYDQDLKRFKDNYAVLRNATFQKEMMTRYMDAEAIQMAKKEVEAKKIRLAKEGIMTETNEKPQIILSKSEYIDNIPAVKPMAVEAPKAKKARRDCSVDQILGMTKLNFSDEQIRAVCGE